MNRQKRQKWVKNNLAALERHVAATCVNSPQAEAANLASEGEAIRRAVEAEKRQKQKAQAEAAELAELFWQKYNTE